MVTLVKGDVVVLPFPFSDLSSSKKRPALVIATLTGADVILCMITTKGNSTYALELQQTDFKSGSLNRKSYIRPERIFTADANIVQYKIGQITQKKQKEVFASLMKLFK